MRLGTTIPIYAPVQPIELPEESAMIVNISESSFRGERTYGTYSICGVGKCKCSPEDTGRCISGPGYIMKLVKPRRGLIDMGDNVWSSRGGKKEPDLKNVNQFVIHAQDIVDDLVREWNADIFGIGSGITGETATETVRGFAGVFGIDGQKPSDDELAQARQLLASCDQLLVNAAHTDWDQFHQPKTIHDAWKRSARRLGVDAPWLYNVLNAAALPDCPHCGSKMKTATATVCAVCHRDVDAQDAGSAVTAPEARAKGRKKVAA